MDEFQHLQKEQEARNGQAYGQPPQQGIQPVAPPASMTQNAGYAPVSASEHRGGMSLIVTVVAVLAAAAAVSLVSILIYRGVASSIAPRSEQYADFNLSVAESPQTDTTIKSGDTVLTAAQIAAKVRPSIVGVITTDNVNLNGVESGEGSGIIIDADGYVITNSHVIGDSTKYDVSVITEDGKSYPAKVLGYDTRSDLAVLKIDAKGLPAAEIGDSTKLVPGDYVVAIGNPGGLQFAGSVTDGIVSGINRIIDSSDSDSTSAMRYIQTNAVINPGNSGGALVNAYGQVVGVNTSKISMTYYEAMSFAVPSSTFTEVVHDLIDYGYVQGRVKLGISCSVLSDAYENQGIPAGLQIREISSESDLNGKAQVYDIITHCDGTRVKTLSQLQDIMFQKKPGDTITLKLYHPASATKAAKEYTVKVKLLEDKGATD